MFECLNKQPRGRLEFEAGGGTGEVTRVHVVDGAWTQFVGNKGSYSAFCRFPPPRAARAPTKVPPRRELLRSGHLCAGDSRTWPCRAESI